MAGQNVKLRPDLLERLIDAACERDVTVTWLVDRLLREAMERLVPADEFRLTRDPLQVCSSCGGSGVQRAPDCFCTPESSENYSTCPHLPGPCWTCQGTGKVAS